MNRRISKCVKDVQKALADERAARKRLEQATSTETDARDVYRRERRGLLSLASLKQYLTDVAAGVDTVTAWNAHKARMA